MSTQLMLSRTGNNSVRVVRPPKLSLKGDWLWESASQANTYIRTKIKPAVPVMHVGAWSITSPPTSLIEQDPPVPSRFGCTVS